jgi:hypothetical protein
MMTPNSGDPLLRQRAEARQVADAEKTRFDELAVVTTAEGVVRSSRITELAEQQKAAYRRVSAARGRLTRARKDGDAEKIAAAARRLRELHAEADQITDTGIREAQHLISSELDNTGALIDQMRHTWDARAAVTDTYRTLPVPSSRRGEL